MRATLIQNLVISYTRGKSKFGRNALLLVGPSDSGKTAILSNVSSPRVSYAYTADGGKDQLAYNQTLPSHTSLQTNSVQMTLSSTTTLRVIDVPGHPRIRDQFREHLQDAKAIAFVVDCSTVSRNGSVVAEYVVFIDDVRELTPATRHLHHVLHAITSLPPTAPTPTLLILAHKKDLLKVGASSNPTSDVAITRVRTILERELEKRRASQTGGVGVESLGAEGEGTEVGGLECSGAGGAFKFSEWEGGEVEFLSTWVKVGEAKEEDGLAELTNWLSK